jgi:dihydropteroate synthase
MSRKIEPRMKPSSLRCGDTPIRFDHPVIMGVLNVTPDSFSDGGLFLQPDEAVARAKQMAEQGADIIDVGGESSRPGSEPVPEEEELRRVEPVIRRLIKEIQIPISIDTYRACVADECLKLGVHMVNDITGLRSKEMIGVVAAYEVPVTVMHMKGMPKTMQQNPVYSDVVQEVKEFLADRIEAARVAGIHDIIVDPGIGFGKTVEHNLEILKKLREFKELNCPILVGPSRKAFIGRITGLPATERLEGTLAAISIAIVNGADIVRVHDVRECRRAAQTAYAIRQAS